MDIQYFQPTESPICVQSGSISKKHSKSCWAVIGSEFSNLIAASIAMKNIFMRSALISVVAISGAMIWGAAEFLALQWSRLQERLRGMGSFRAH
jgi:hypothetical protein